MKRAYRIGYWRYRTDEEFGKFLSFVQRHIAEIDELALFTEFSHHGYFPIEWWEGLGASLAPRIRALRAAGVPSVGLNVLCTFGHVDEAWDVLPKSALGTMVGPDGYVTTSNLCPSAPGYEEYIAAKYRALAASGPDFIWLDDDIRMDNHGVRNACYCEHCLARFESTCGVRYGRDELVEALNSPEGGRVREAWGRHLSDTLARVCERVRAAIHEVNPAIQVGLMTYGRIGQIHARGDAGRWMEALTATKGRPGGGFYNDVTPIGWVHKCLEIEEQIDRYPAAVRDIQYEMENFPYQRLSKSLVSLMNECTGALMNGVNGIAFNALFYEDYDALLQKVKAFTPLWQAIDRIAGAGRNAGLLPCLDPDFNVHRSVNGDYFDLSRAAKVKQTNILAEIGIPLTYARDNACGFILVGPMAEALPDGQIEEILTSGVMMDGEALEALIRRGYGDLCGVGIRRVIDNGVRERFTSDPVNAVPYDYPLSDLRDPFITFWRGESTCYLLEPLGPSVRVISNMDTVLGDKVGPCCTLYENERGGRVAVFGYLPWQFLYSPQKRWQMVAVADWISRGALPVRIDACLKVVPFVRINRETGETLIMLTNAFLDPTGVFEVRLRGGGTPHRIGMTGECEPLPYRRDGEDAVVSLSLGAWEFAVIKLDR